MPAKFTPYFFISVGLVDLAFFNHTPNMVALGFLFIIWGGFLLLLPLIRKPKAPAPKGPVVTAIPMRGPMSFIAQKPSLSDELAKLSILRDKGVLTDAEFENQKRKLLG
jgi:hypothetical protein